MGFRILPGQVSRPVARSTYAVLALLVATSFACSAVAQGASAEAGPAAVSRLTIDAASTNPPALPDAPGEHQTSSSADNSAPPPIGDFASSVGPTGSAGTQPSKLPEASPRDRYPLPGQPAPILSPGDKVVMGLQGAFSPFAAIGWISSAGYEQITSTPPNYGTDRGAFGQRLGASAIRAISEDVLADSILAPAFHEDPRYYRLGRSHRFLARVVYAATRAVITRSDDGRTVPNYSQIGGNLIGAVLTNAYYPQSNRTVGQTVETFGGSLGGTALGNVIAELFGDMLFDRH
jgi:hypothetical protein